MTSSLEFLICQIGPRLGQVDLNVESVISTVCRHKNNRKQVFIFPEGFLTGYPVNDLLNYDFLTEKIRTGLLRIQSNINHHQAVIVGGVWGKNPRFNVAFFITKTKVQVVKKTHLPDYDIFFEKRLFESGKWSGNIVEFAGIRMLLTVCEDLWHTKDLIGRWKLENFDVIINISASVFHIGKRNQRMNVAMKVNKFFGKSLIYCNSVHLQDEWLFDGSSFALSADGKIIVQLKAFKEQIKRVSFDELVSSNFVEGSEHLQKFYQKTNGVEVIKAIIFGIREFVQSTSANKVFVGLSGGVDSAVVANLAVKALGSQSVVGVFMPSSVTSSLSEELVVDLVKRLKIEYLKIPIHDWVKLAQDQLTSLFAFKPDHVAWQNLQSRMRMIILMFLANACQGIVLGTSNKSELAVGYGTLYGDLAAALLPIGDLFKSEVYLLAQWFVKKGLMHQAFLTRPPTAELVEGQMDEQQLLPYAVLDGILRQVVEYWSIPNSEKVKPWGFFKRHTVVVKQTDVEKVWQWVTQSEFKRFQSPPILKLKPVAFGRGRLVPFLR